MDLTTVEEEFLRKLKIKTGTCIRYMEDVEI